MARFLDEQSPFEQQRRPLSESLRVPLDPFPGLPGIQQVPTEDPRTRGLEMRIASIEDRLKKLGGLSVGFIKIKLLPTRTLTEPLDAIVEPDEDGFIARTTDLPLYGFGEDPIEAVEVLKDEIESLYDDLIEDDQFSDEWLRIKDFLMERIVR